MNGSYAIEAIDSDESRGENDRTWSIDPYFSGPEAGNNPDRHRGLGKFDQIKTPAERATMIPPEEEAERGVVL